MGWFEEQINARSRMDNENMKDANLRLSSIVMGEKVLWSGAGPVKDAEDEIVRWYKVDKISDLAQRNVILTDDWYNNCLGAMMAETKDGDKVALIPRGSRGYTYIDRKTGTKNKVTKNSPLKENAVCYYKSLPKTPINLKDLYGFVFKNLTFWDLFPYFFFSLVAVLLGMFMPHINKVLFSVVVPDGSTSLLFGISVLLVSVILSMTLVNICSALAISRIQTKIDVSASPAIYLRLLSLPVSFFKDFASGELSERSSAIKNLNAIFFGQILSTVVIFLFSIVYLFQIGSLAPGMGGAALWVLIVVFVVTVINTMITVMVSSRKMKASAKLNGFIYQILNGIQKIKLTGSEKRIYSKWADRYAEKAKYDFNPPLLNKISTPINAFVTMLSSVVFYVSASRNGLSVADYMAFSVAFGFISMAVLSLGSVVSAVAQLRPNIEMAKPIMDAEPEHYSDKIELVNPINRIELSNICFRYNIDTPDIFKDFSLTIKKGEYVAIVGKTGCGKSTLVRLLLGFEKPQKGAVYFNGINSDELDFRSLRQKMGVVMQSSRLFRGDIFSNIAISSPGMTHDDAWKIAAMVGFDKDIESFPMGMHTLITEGGGGLSGGQRQRLVIARAIAAHPDVLIFDEATSALDNITQKQVSDSLDSLKCTRIVIAHRLSTIRHCDRIIVIDGGKIVEEGDFETLINNGKYFADLVKRQM